MKPISICLLLIAISTTQLCAQNRRTFKINPGQTLMEAIPPSEALSSPSFVPGEIQFRNGNYANAPLLYNYLIPGLQFINAKGDTMTLDKEPEVKLAVLQKDTFYYDKGYYRQVASFNDMILAEKQFFEFSNRQKIGGMGELTSASIDTYNSVSSNNYFASITAKEVITLSKYRYLYIGDRFNHFTVVSKKGLLDVFPAKEMELMNYLKSNKVDFSNVEEVKKLIFYLKANS